MTGSRRPRWHRRHPRATLALVAASGVIATLVAIELLLAALLAHPEWVAHSPSLLGVVRNVYVREDWSLIQSDPDRMLYDPQLLYLLKPGTSRFSNREFTVTLDANSEGLRDDEASLAGPEIIVLGDSYGLGWGVEQEESFAAILEERTGPKSKIATTDFHTRTLPGRTA